MPRSDEISINRARQDALRPRPLAGGVLILALIGSAPIDASLGSGPPSGTRTADAASTALERASGHAPWHVATVINPKVGSGPSDRDPAIDLAQEHLRNRQFDRAIELAAKLIAADPKDPDGYNIEGAAYAGKLEWAKARKSFETALAARPNDIPTLVNLAQLDLHDKDPASARKRFQAILTINDKYVPAMIGLSGIADLEKNDRDSLAWLEKAKSADPRAIAPRVALGAYHLRRQDAPAALAELEEAQRLDPNNPQVLSLLGTAQSAMGQKALAVTTYRRLVSLQPDWAVAHYRLGVAQIENRDASDGARSLRKAVQLRPDYVEATVALAELFVKDGRMDDALKLAKSLQNALPGSPAGLTLEGDVLMRQGRYSDALKIYQRAFGVQQTGIGAIKLHAAETKAGNPKGADAKLQQWLKAHPDDVTVKNYAARQGSK
jgi:putative PEP-CTERM system TPR-repeat lipoprotein